MMKYYEPKYFLIAELVSKDTYRKLGSKALLTLDYRILKTADTLREFFCKPIKVNDWFTGGRRNYSGYRNPNCTVGSVFSQHRFGRALDMIIKDVSAKDARKAIMSNQNHFPYITAIEDGVSWLHIDCRAIVGSGIYLFKP